MITLSEHERMTNRSPLAGGTIYNQVAIVGLTFAFVTDRYYKRYDKLSDQ